MNMCLTFFICITPFRKEDLQITPQGAATPRGRFAPFLISNGKCKFAFAVAFGSQFQKLPKVTRQRLHAAL